MHPLLFGSPGIKRVALTGLALLVTLLVWDDTTRAQNQSSQITLEVSPAAIALPPVGEGTRQTLVVVRNSTNTPIQDLRLSWMSDTSIEIDAPDLMLAQLHVGAAHAWTLTLSRTEQSQLTGTVQLRLDYAALVDDKPNPQVALAVLQIGAPPITPLAKIVDLQIRSTTGGIDERHPGNVYLVLTNTMSTLITAGPITATLSTSDVTPRVISSPSITLPSRTTGAVLVRLIAATAVQSGKYLVVFHVPVTWQEGGRPQQGTVVATHEISVGIIGESALLTALGIPSLFFLPGFLAVVTAGMVWRIGRPAEATFALGPPAPEFWVVAITLSFLISGSYGRVTGRDILDGYGLTDILWLWVVSIMLGAVAVYPTIGLLRLFDKLRRGIIQWWTNQTQPTPNDTALKMLKKLDRQGLGTYVEQVTWTDGDQKRTCYLLEPWRPGHATHWVGPEMIIEWNNAPAERQNQIRQAAEQGQPAELAQLLRQGQQARFLTFDWRRDRIPDRPTSIATTALERVGEQPIISGL